MIMLKRKLKKLGKGGNNSIAVCPALPQKRERRRSQPKSEPELYAQLLLRSTPALQGPVRKVSTFRNKTEKVLANMSVF